MKEIFKHGTDEILLGTFKIKECPPLKFFYKVRLFQDEGGPEMFEIIVEDISHIGLTEKELKNKIFDKLREDDIRRTGCFTISLKV